MEEESHSDNDIDVVGNDHVDKPRKGDKHGDQAVKDNLAAVEKFIGKNKLKDDFGNIPKKRKQSTVKGKSKSRKLDSKLEGTSVDEARVEARAPPSPPAKTDSSENASEDEGDSSDSDDSDKSKSDSDSDSEEETTVTVSQTASGDTPVYNRFDPSDGDQVVFKFPNDDMNKYVTKMFTSFISDRRLKESITDDFPVPQGVPGLEVPTIDDYVQDIFIARKQEYGKTVDDIWCKTQNRVLDVMGPLGKLWTVLDTARLVEEDSRELDLFDCLEMVEKAITLLGQANTTINHNRRQNVLFKMTKDSKKAKMLLKQHDVSDMKSHSALFGKSYYKKLQKSAKIKKATKEISSQLGEAKPAKQSFKGKGSGSQPFQKGSSSSGRGGGRKATFTKKGKSSNRGKCLFKLSRKQKVSVKQTCKQVCKTPCKISGGNLSQEKGKRRDCSKRQTSDGQCKSLPVPDTTRRVPKRGSSSNKLTAARVRMFSGYGCARTRTVRVHPLRSEKKGGYILHYRC